MTSSGRTAAQSVAPRPATGGLATGTPSQARLINEHVRQGWKDYGLTASPKATDGEWCRRLYLDVLGRIPTVDELRRFVTSRGRYKQRKLVDQLLYEEPYADEFAQFWATLWTNVLIGRSGGTERNSLTSRAGMQAYLRDAFATGKPYDRMVLELVTATGTTRPGTEGYNGATNFLADKVNDEKGSLATAATARIFLGMQVQCTQCHNHPFNDWKQRKFWELNAFFRQTRALRRQLPVAESGQMRIAYGELVDRDFAGEGSTPDDAEIYYELRNGELQVAYPVFLDGAAIPRSGYVRQVRRRQELGRLIVNSKMLEQMMVNRTWAHFLGHGFTRPIDDLGPHNAPSHPELLAALAAEFRQASFDVRSLIRWIVLSEPYELSSRTNKSNAELDDPSLGEPPRFSRFYLRQLQAEQLYESLLTATAAHKAQRAGADEQRDKEQWLRQFTVAFGTDEGGESTTFDGTIPQALVMFNGDLIKRAISLDPGTMLRNVVDGELTPADKVHYLFEAGLARRATKDELLAANQLLLLHRGIGAEVLQDLWWAILNSNEFIMNH